MACTGGVAGWERPFTHTSQTTEDWRAALRGMEAWRVGSSHALPTAKSHMSGAQFSIPVRSVFDMLFGTIKPAAA